MDSLTVIEPDERLAFIAGFSVEDFHGIGPVTAEKMQALGIETGADLQATPGRELAHHFGTRGCHFKELAMGEDDRPVRPDRERTSVGAERTFSNDIARPQAMLDQLEPIARRVAERLREADRRGRTVTLKLKSRDHDVSTRQTALERPVALTETLMTLVGRLLQRPHPPKEPIRLLGVSVSLRALECSRGIQLKLNFRSLISGQLGASGLP